MSKAVELKAKNENLFERNTILINVNERLKKENAELKEQVEIKEKVNREMLTPAIDRTLKQLAQAKVIIEKLYSHVFQGMDFMELNDFNVLKAEAEQFLEKVK